MSFSIQPQKKEGTLREQLDSIAPALREMRLSKDERVKQFRSVKGEIQKISAEIAGRSTFEDSTRNITIDDNDLSSKKLEEYQNELHKLHDEKVPCNIRMALLCTYQTVLAFPYHVVFDCFDTPE